jgi:alkanesulfonate monooxygenase SsuD/methylene tetrahydromethanopterin reductase-like flavin-dependent oxidoreductase (luciferase family)
LADIPAAPDFTFSRNYGRGLPSKREVISERMSELAERGKFDGIFLADIVGVYDDYDGGPGPSIVNAAQIPVNDPMMVVPAMAAVTTQIGFEVTANLTYEPPYLFARRLSTLDHLTRGRVGWNTVTGYLDCAARGMGLAVQPDHDGRYDVADEYMEFVYQLWGGGHARARPSISDPSSSDISVWRSVGVLGRVARC